MGQFNGSYVVRYGWTRTGVLSVMVMVLLIGAEGFLSHTEPPVMDHVDLVFSPFAVWIAAVCFSHRKSVEVDRQGITLYRFLPFRRPEFVAWSEVVAVNWSVEGPPWRRGSDLEVYRRTPWQTAACPSTSPRREALDACLATQDDPDFVAAFRNTTRSRRSTTLSRIDPVCLAAAIACLAPDVRHLGDLGDVALDGQAVGHQFEAPS
ncbi:hypothetical protein [Actinacidiphila rubida]|uniref:hypothetical protein n=1 Tax=Actinacidiphila rubida TaxID=310780 RepID=UPI00114D1C6B|nr:hypothetical protein [Actinacidiphila rubida]